MEFSGWEGAGILAGISDPPAAVNAVAWSHDGKRLAFGDDGPLVRVWNVDEKRDITIRGGPISNLTFALDDKSVYFAGRTHDNVMLWELNTNRNSRSLATGPNGVSALALTLNGRSLVTATHQFFCCWEVSSGRELWALTVPTDGPRFLDRPFAISPDGRVLAIAKAERFDDDAIVWSVSIYDVPPLP